MVVRRNGKVAATEERTATIVYPQPRENRVVATIVLATHYHIRRHQWGFYRYHDHPGGRLPPLLRSPTDVPRLSCGFALAVCPLSEVCTSNGVVGHVPNALDDLATAHT